MTALGMTELCTRAQGSSLCGRLGGFPHWMPPPTPLVSLYLRERNPSLAGSYPWDTGEGALEPIID